MICGNLLYQDQMTDVGRMLEVYDTVVDRRYYPGDA